MGYSIKLINDDCLSAIEKLDSSFVDLIITDPPYNLGQFMKNRDTNLKQMRENFFVSAGWDDLSYDDWIKEMKVLFSNAFRVLKNKGTMIVFMSIIKVESIIKIAEEAGFYYKTTGIWHKTNPMPRNMNLHFINSTECWIYFVKKSKTGTFNNNGKALHDFIETSLTPSSEKKYGTHPTQKPEKMIEFLVKTLSNEGDIVLDTFMGTGVTGVVSAKNNRSFIGVELNKKYYEIAKLRISDVVNSEYSITYKIGKDDNHECD